MKPRGAFSTPRHSTTCAAPDSISCEPRKRVDALEAQQIGLVSKVVQQETLLAECYAIAERIHGFSQLGVELSKQMLWAGMEAGSLHSHMNHEGHAQLFVRMTTKNFEEAIKARKEKRAPDFKD